MVIVKKHLQEVFSPNLVPEP